MFQTYKPSGRFGFSIFPLLLVGLLIAAVLAYIYQLALSWIPFIYVNFLATIGLGVALGLMSAWFVELAKVRNVMLAAGIGLLLLVGAVGAKNYFQFRQMISDEVAFQMDAANLPAGKRPEVEEFVRAQLTFMKHIEFRTARGWDIGRGGGGIPIKGPFVYLIWLIEAVVIGYSAIGTPMARAREPFSEKMNEWAGEEEVVMLLPVTDAKMVSQINSAASVDELLEIPIPKTDESHQFAQYKVNSIKGVELEDAYLSVDLITITLNSNGQQEKNEEPLVRHAILSSAQRMQLEENASLLREAMAEYRQAVQDELAAEAIARVTTENEGNEQNEVEKNEDRSK